MDTPLNTPAPPPEIPVSAPVPVIVPQTPPPAGNRKFIFLLVILLLLFCLIAGFFILRAKKPLTAVSAPLSGNLPSDYAACMTGSQYIKDTFHCRLLYTKKDAEFADCAKRGHISTMETDPGGSVDMCELVYYNPAVTFPADFPSCQAIIKMDLVNFPDNCVFDITRDAAYDKEIGDKIYALCLSRGGMEQSGNCFISYNRPKDSGLPVASDYAGCKAAKGSLTGRPFQPGDNGNTASIMIPACDVSYNSVTDPGQFSGCLAAAGTKSDGNVINGVKSFNCHLRFWETPVSLIPKSYAYITPVFQNNEKSNIQNFIVADNTLIVGVGYDGVYGIDLPSGKQLWFYPAQYMDTYFVYDASRHNFILNVGANNTRLVALGIRDGAEKWKYSSDLFAPLYEMTDGNIKISLYKADVITRVIILDGSRGTVISDTQPNLKITYKENKAVYSQNTIQGEFGTVFAVNTKTGARVWSTPIEAGNATPYVSDNTKIEVNGKQVLFAGGSGVIYALDPDTGKINWSFCGKSVFHFAQFGPSSVIFEAPDKNLYLIDMAKITPGDLINLFPGTPALSCKK